MTEKIKESMKKKGWSKDELKHLDKVLKENKKRDYLMKKSLSHFFYWTSIFLIVLLNFLGMLILSPFLVILDGLWIYAFTGFFALAIGFMINHLVLMTSHAEIKHHVIALLLVPALCIADIIIFSKYFDFLGTIFKLQSTFKVTPLIIFFVLCFTFPYITTALLHKFKR